MGFVHSYEQVIPLQARIFTLPPLYWPRNRYDVGAAYHYQSSTQ